MQTDPVDFQAFKQSRDLSVVYIGDTVEWEDYNDEIFTGKVIRIEYKNGVGSLFSGENIQRFPLWEKEEYVVHLEGGLSVVGNVVLRKLIKSGTRATRSKMARSQ